MLTRALGTDGRPRNSEQAFDALHTRKGARPRDVIGTANESRERKAMRKGYWVAFADVHDPDGYKAYIAANAAAFAKYGARFLVRGGAVQAPEGSPRTRTVVIEFPSYDAALACYRSPEYAAAMALRQGKSTMDLVIVEGYDGPQPASA